MVIYSRELRGITYFEVYGFNPVMYGRKKYVVCEGMSLSSFRPIGVLVPYNKYSELKKAVVKKYVVLKSSSNRRVTISDSDRIANIYDRKRLRQLTGREATIPERIAMRLRTLQRMSDRMFFTHWKEVSSYMPEILVLLALYYVRSRLGMKLFRIEGLENIRKLVWKIHYLDGLLIDHDDVYVFVPRPISHVHYNELRRAFISLKIEEQHSEDEEEYMGELHDEEEEEEYDLPI